MAESISSMKILFNPRLSSSSSVDKWGKTKRGQNHPWFPLDKLYDRRKVGSFMDRLVNFPFYLPSSILCFKQWIVFE
jgi:hypothetical protein